MKDHTLKTPCKICRVLIDPLVKRCPNCKAANSDKLCNVCAEPMLDGANRCNECDSYQTVPPRFVNVSAIVSTTSQALTALSIVASAWLWISSFNSDTGFRVTGAESDRIYVTVWNTGREPSVLVGFHLIFEGLPKQETTLDIDTADQKGDDAQSKSIIQPGKFVTFSLTRPLQTTLVDRLRNKQYISSDVVRLRQGLWQHNTEPWLRLSIDVEESNSGSEPHAIIERFPESRISDFVRGTWK